MGQAVATCRILPAVSVKPAEISRCLPLNQAAWGKKKTANFKGYPCRVEKRVLMAAIDRKRMPLFCYDSTACTAEQCFTEFFLLVFLCLALRLVFSGGRELNPVELQGGVNHQGRTG